MAENLEEKALAAYHGIFNNQEYIEVDGEKYYLEYTSLQHIRKFNIDGYNYIEQNPDKGSRWAKRAREGSKIMWVMKGRGYIAQVRDGEFHDFRKHK
jgi:hypothetical protein